MFRNKLAVFFLLALVPLFFLGCQREGEKAKVKSKTDARRPPKVKKVKEKKAAPAARSLPATTTLTLYFGDAEGAKLIKVSRNTTATRTPAKAAIEQLIAGPKQAGLYPVIPKGTKLLGVSIRDKTAIVDFSPEFVDNHPGGSSAELLTIFGVVDTLTEFPTIDSVRFLVDGKEISSLAGHYDLSRPVKHDKRLIAGP